MMSRPVFLLFVLLCSGALDAVHAQRRETSDEQQIIAAAERLFAAMRARDAAALRVLLHDQARIVSVRSTGDAAFRSKEEWIESIAGSSVVLDERIFAPEVRIDGHLATLWARYTFRRGEELSHCGIDAFQYVRLGGEWRAITLAFTTRTTNCESMPPIPAPGKFVDLGGWRVHLDCTGLPDPSRPTVILEAGAGGFSVDWRLVQPEVARFARVCSYDRAGLGWSELGPRPRTLRQVVWELHTLLDRAGVPPPYVLVGHSYGGILARLYAWTYPSDVVGMVLEESGHEGGVAVFRNGRMVRLVETATGTPIPPVKTSDPVRESDVTGPVREQIEAAARQMAAHANEPPRDRLPPDAQRMRAWAFAQVKHWAANDNPFEGEELAALLAEQKKRTHPLGDMPLIVLSRGTPDADARAEEEHTRNQAALVRLSSAGRQVIARQSGHEILMSEPGLVVAAIRDVLAAARR